MKLKKAHPTVFKALLNILDTGEMTDNHKNRVSFRNAIIIFTTNLGYDKDFAKEKRRRIHEVKKQQAKTS